MKDHIQSLGILPKKGEIRLIGFNRKDLSFWEMYPPIHNRSADIGACINNDWGFTRGEHRFIPLDEFPPSAQPAKRIILCNKNLFKDAEVGLRTAMFERADETIRRMKLSCRHRAFPETTK